MTATNGDAEAGLRRLVQDAPPRRDSAGSEPESGQGRIEITLTGDRRDVEAMSLELRRLAKARGLEIGDVRVLPADGPPRELGGVGGSG